MNDVIIYTLLGCAYFLLVWKAGSSFPLLYLFVFTFFLQYVFSTYLIYNQYDVLENQMPINQQRLFSYAIPALISLFAGVFVFNKEVSTKRLFEKIDHGNAYNLGMLLFLVSYSLELAPFLGVNFFNSILSFTSYLKYVAAFCFLFSNSKFGYVLVALIYGQLALSVLRTGVFMDLIIWSTYLFFIVAIRFRLLFVVRASFILVALPVLILIQSVKDEYRESTWSGKREGGIGLFTELAQKNSKKDGEGPFAESTGVISAVGRLSQGWHLGLVLRRVPKKEPFSNGEEMVGDIVASFVPRLLFEDKKVTHTAEKFYKYTGHKLPKKTAMTIGILGDFYINFGRWGSFVMLFVFGATIAKLINYFIRRYVIPDPLNVVWIPFMFTYLVRADNDFYIFFNGLVKGFLIFLLVNFIRKQLWPVKQLHPSRL